MDESATSDDMAIPDSVEEMVLCTLVRRLPILATIAVLCAAKVSFAQANRPIPAVVVDARGLTVGFGADQVTAEDLAIELFELPSRGWGVMAGANVYPLRWRGFAAGASFEMLIGRGTRTNRTGDGEVFSVVERRIRSTAIGVSMNFGHRDGFSYVTVGRGPFMFDTSTDTRPPGDSPESQTTLNFGGGARWFTTTRMAFGFDVRFYETKPINPTPTSPGRERRRLLVLSAGISIR
jgi:hypothetical protein